MLLLASRELCSIFCPLIMTVSSHLIICRIIGCEVLSVRVDIDGNTEIGYLIWIQYAYHYPCDLVILTGLVSWNYFSISQASA